MPRRDFLLAAYAALLVGAICIIVAGCAGSHHPSPPRAPAATTFSQPAGLACHPRNPPAMGECVGDHFGLTAPQKIEHTEVGTKVCADLSQWQGFYPNLTGLRCVIIQATYGPNIEPSVYSQIADARAHHVPWGAYGFMEGDSGAAEANLAVRVTSGRGRTLGVWADAEVGAAYSQACSFTAQAHRAGAYIYGLFAAPGMWPGGRCAGWLWPSEWDVPAVYPFAGYPSSAIKLWQDCGTCSRYGVETDRDVDEGLIALGHPKPKPRPLSPAERRRLIARWTAERHAVLHRYHLDGCRGGSTGPKCTALRAREHLLYLDIRRLT